MKKMLLVSQSPRRQKLLHDAGISFSVVSNMELTEVLKPGLDIDDQIKDLAQQKAEQAMRKIDDSYLHDKVILTADTMVVFKGKAMGKPQSKEDAVAMLSLLSGNTHSVKTGYCFVDVEPEKWVVGIETTFVHFRTLKDNEIVDYVDSGEPMDKAGAYGIQGEAGKFVSHIEGSYSNVVGLPIEALSTHIEMNRWNNGWNK